MRIFSSSPEETLQKARELYPHLKEDAILCFFGDLASGKTTFIKGIAEAAGVAPEQVSSPTFVYLNIYQGSRTIYHFDLYRLTGVDPFLSLGFEEFLFSPGIKCLEWSERIASIIPPQAIQITFTATSETSREIVVEGL